MTTNLRPDNKLPLKWIPITDFEESVDQLADSDLGSLSLVWRRKKHEITKTASCKRLLNQINREWVIETGLIEGLYVLDDDVVQRLVVQGLNFELLPATVAGTPKTVIQLLRDQQAALQSVFDFVDTRRHLSTSYIKELHAGLTQHQHECLAIDRFGTRKKVALLKGDYKKTPNNPTRTDGSEHPYCPPEHVAAEMDRLVALHEEHTQKNVPPEVEAAWLHHRFTKIHPFQDGNGRVTRCLALFVLIRAGLLPFVVRSTISEIYFDALETADRGSLRPLVTLIADQQKGILDKVLSFSSFHSQGSES